MTHRLVLAALALLGALACASCSEDDNSAPQGIDVHCNAATPTGSTTVRVDCPPQ